MMKRVTFRSLAFSILLIAAFSLHAAEPKTHTLAKGETLYSVSRIYKVPYEALAAANNITDPTKLRIGTILTIPSMHVVEKGETLFGISRKYGISMQELLNANKLGKDYMLKIGDMLVIPASSASVQETAVPATIPTSPASTVTTATPPVTTTTAAPAPPPQTPSTSPASAETASSSTTTTTTTTVRQASPGNAAPLSGAPASGIAAGSTVPPSTTIQAKPVAGISVPMPEPVKTQDKTVNLKLKWPVEGSALYLDGKLEGIMIRAKEGIPVKAIASGTVVSAGPSRGFNQVVFVQSKSGYVYVYGGNGILSVKTGDQVTSGTVLGHVGADAKDESPIAYFFVFRNGQPVDPASAPRD